MVNNLRPNGTKGISNGFLQRAALHPNAFMFHLQGACGVACGRWNARHGEHLGRSEKEKSRGLRQAQPRLVRVNTSRGSTCCSATAWLATSSVHVVICNRAQYMPGSLHRSVASDPSSPPQETVISNFHMSTKARQGIPLNGYIWTTFPPCSRPILRVLRIRYGSVPSATDYTA